MRSLAKILAAVVAFATLPAPSQAATMGGYDYAVQYDYREFYSIADNKTFQVILVGNPFPDMPMAEVASQMLPLMQIGKPPPNVTFTYDQPAEEPRPYYRMILTFNAVNDVGGDSVCRGKARSTNVATPGRVKLFAVYCRNDQAMSQVIAWASAERPNSPDMQRLFTELFTVLFPRGQGQHPQNGGMMFR